MSSHRYADLAALVRERQPACGSTTVVAVDGPSGGGKTELAAGLADSLDAAVLHLDDVYPGWTGLASTPALVRPALETIAVGGIGEVPRWSWVRHEPTPATRVQSAPTLIVDGVGSGARMLRSYLSLLIWVDADSAVRKRRALARDGGTYEPFWDIWAEQERRHFAAEETRSHADVVVQTDV